MDKPIKLDVLAIAAHPDDVELSCGGLLLKLAQKKLRTGIIDITQGEMGTLGSKEHRIKEALTAGKLLGLAYRANMGLPDAAVVHNLENSYKLAAMIRLLQPELVILPHWEQRHPDHLAASKMGYDACFFAGLKKLQMPGEATRPRKIIYASYFREAQHSFLVDITAQMEDKCKAVACYASQFNDQEASKRIFYESNHDIFSLLRNKAAHLGSRAGVNFAEAYTIKEDILIDDPFLMGVKSI